MIVTLSGWVAVCYPAGNQDTTSTVVRMKEHDEEGGRHSDIFKVRE